MNESIESIVTEMRERADAMQTHGTTHGVRLAVLEFARRIESAWKREREEVEADALEVGGIVEAARTAEKSSAVGNAAAMREALEDVLEKIDRWRTDGVMEHWQYSQLFDIADAALSAPPRQCDVGTAEEQAERMRLYCNSHGVDESGCFRCERCQFLTVDKCELAWAQMPYDAEEGGAE